MTILENSYVEQFAEGLRRNIETSLKENKWCLNQIVDSMVNNTAPLDVVQKYEKEIVPMITKENFDRIASDYIDTENYYKVVLMPEK